MTSYIDTLYASASALPSGSMRGGTQRAAYAFIERLHGLTAEEAAAALSTAKATAKSDYVAWLASLPEPVGS